MDNYYTQLSGPEGKITFGAEPSNPSLRWPEAQEVQEPSYNPIGFRLRLQDFGELSIGNFATPGMKSQNIAYCRLNIVTNLLVNTSVNIATKSAVKF